jgi:L-alanine-DL-glutamate epimerase-like enolase superfamily enzyme
VVSRGFTALKTNIVIPGDPAQVYMPGFGGGAGTTDQVVTTPVIRAIENLIGTFRGAVGPDVDICLDLNFNFKTEACLRIAKAVEPFNLLWLEIDMYDPDALLQIKQSTTTRICTGENFYSCAAIVPISRSTPRRRHDRRAMERLHAIKEGRGPGRDVWLNVAPHNYYSHLSTLMSAHLCAVLPNVRIMEIDIDDVP